MNITFGNHIIYDANRSDEKFDLLLFMGIFLAYAMNNFAVFLKFLGIPDVAFDHLAAIKISILAILLVRQILRKRISIYWLLFIGCYLFVLLCSGLFNPDNAKYTSSIFTIFLNTVLPAIVTIQCSKSPNSFLSYLRITSYFSLTRILMAPFSTSVAVSGIVYRSMGMVYDTIVPWSVILYFAFKDKKIYDIMIAIIVPLLYVTLGTRGAIICIVLIILYDMYLMTKNRNKLVFFFYLMLIVGAFTYLLYAPILNYARNILANKGLYTDVIDKILNYGITYGNGRDTIWKKDFEYISQHWLMGGGIGVDRAIFNNSGAYAHNFVIELLMDFGIIFGTALVIIIVRTVIKYLFNNNIQRQTRALISIFMIPGISMLLVSGSIYESYTVFAGITVIMTMKEFLYEDSTYWNKSSG